MRSVGTGSWARQRTRSSLANVKPHCNDLSWKRSNCMSWSLNFPQAGTGPENDVNFWVGWLLVCHSSFLVSVVGFTPSHPTGLSSIYRKIRGKNFQPNSQQGEIPLLRISATCSAWPAKCFLRDITQPLNFPSVTAGWSFQPERQSVSWWVKGSEGRAGPPSLPDVLCVMSW